MLQLPKFFFYFIDTLNCFFVSNFGIIHASQFLLLYLFLIRLNYRHFELIRSPVSQLFPLLTCDLRKNILSITLVLSSPVITPKSFSSSIWYFGAVTNGSYRWKFNTNFSASFSFLSVLKGLVDLSILVYLKHLVGLLLLSLFALLFALQCYHCRL